MYQQLFPFELSPFQIKACNGIDNKKHVLVTAHTGSGKTLPAEYAIHYYTSQNKKVIYTSPIKALSNQKFDEFTKKFPSINVGILTGDIKHNPNADVLIMTTEILQNNLFKTFTKNKKNIELDFEIDMEHELGCVIFDEVHYIDDPERGTVWEQSMIMLPDHIPFVMLSATIGEIDTFANWICNITNKEVEVCTTNERVVPLTFYHYFCVPNKIIENTKDKQIKSKIMERDHTLDVIYEKNHFYSEKLDKSKQCILHLNKNSMFTNRKYVLNELCCELKNNNMFPCLFFVFSRKKVEEISKELNVCLFTDEELQENRNGNIENVCRQMLVSKVTNWKEYIILEEFTYYVELLKKGIGVHHSGMLPIFKELIEMLYEQKYIKCLVCTETFAIGLNMPTKTVVFTSLKKHDGTQLRNVLNHEFIQMAGRAGRRNIDTKGHVIILPNLFEPIETNRYYQYFHSNPKILKSKFKIGYTLILQYLSQYSMKDFVKFVEKSMMNIDIHKGIKTSIIEIEKAEKAIEDIMIVFSKDDYNVCKSLYELQEKIQYTKNKERKKIHKEIRDKMEHFNKDDKLYQSKIKQYKFIHDYELEKEKNENYKIYAENYIKSQIEGLVHVLNENNFIIDNKLSEKGELCCFINEIHKMVFIDLYYQTNKFNDYDECDIFSILSCFCELKIKDDFKTNVPRNFKEITDYIYSRINYYQDMEIKYGLSSVNQYSLQYDMMEYVLSWMKDTHDESSCILLLDKIKNEKDIFIGDFIKIGLKLINIGNEIEKMCQETLDLVLLEKIKKGKDKITKFIINNSSLYV
jgi:superfamily II RNA helicase